MAEYNIFNAILFIRNEWILIQFFVKKLKDGSSGVFLFSYLEIYFKVQNQN